jgi:hypothetical protein
MLVIGVAVAALAAALLLYLVVERVGRAGLPLAALRAAAWGGVAALLVNPSCRRGVVAPRVVVLLDHSLSMSSARDTAGGGARWRAAVDTARALAGRGGRILMFGTEPEAWRAGARPDAPASRLLPAWRAAAALGGPVAVVTDGEVDDARALPSDFLRTARVVVLPRPLAADVGVAALDLPATLRAGDTATARVVLVAAGTARGDTARVVFREDGRVAARVTVPVGEGGSFRRELRFVPAAPRPPAEREVRRYTVRVSGLGDDAEPRDDARATLAEVTRASTIALFSDSPDWDFRRLVLTLRATSGVPVSAYVRVTPDGPWRDADSLRAVSEATIHRAARAAALVVLHGTSNGTAALRREAAHALWLWTEGRETATPGDWYVAATPTWPSPLGAALAGVPPDSLPPLEALAPAGSRPDTSGWVAVPARLARRGPASPVFAGAPSARGPVLRVLGWGLWRWASKGGVAAEGYRSLVAAATNWLLAAATQGAPSLLARRDSLERGLDELLPRPATLHAQAGAAVRAAGEPEPLRRRRWVYLLVLGALTMEWIVRRRRGMR